jgi:branched-subunit amino acid transport protein
MDPRTALILLMAGTNAALKATPVKLLAGRKLPPFFVTWLKYVPVPVLAAMLASDLLVRDGRCHFAVDNQLLVASIPAFVVAYLTRSLAATVLAGVAVLVVWRNFLA